MLLKHTCLAQEEAEHEQMDSPEKKAWSSLHGAWGKRPNKQSQLYNSGN